MDRDTVDVYEHRASEWTARRRPARVEEARGLARRTGPGAVRADLGSGPGFVTGALGAPVVALDAARTMLGLVRRRAPSAWCVQGDLEALPFRDRSLGAAWAQASYLHVPRAGLPRALAQLHRACAPGAPFLLVLRSGRGEGRRRDDDFPGRFFARWEAGPLTDVLVGAGFAVEALRVEDEWIVAEATRARSLPDTVGPGMRLLVCGLNPSLSAADAGVGFAGRSNRFWPAAVAAGLVPRDRDPFAALAAGVGMTDLVKRATPGAAELRTQEYREGAGRVERLVRWLRPRASCVVGLAGWRAAVDRHARPGPQPLPFGGRPVYLMPSTSGLNARSRPEDLVGHLRAAAALAASAG